MTDAVLTFQAQNVIKLHFESETIASEIAEQTLLNAAWTDFKERGGIEGNTDGSNLQAGDVILAQTKHPKRPGGRYFSETDWLRS